MEECKSMYHGGELVSALDCDFESYRELGLLCPFCNEPVYLCGETVRQSSKTHKLSYIRPHFKHFPGGDPLDFDCEKRAISAEGKRYLDAIRAERRGQRLELFNRYFLEIFFSRFEVRPMPPGLDPKDWKSLFGIRKTSWLKKVGSIACELNLIRKLWSSNLEEIHAAAERWTDCPVTEEENEKNKEFFAFLASIDLKLQRMIVGEIIDWLATRSAGSAWNWLIIALPPERFKEAFDESTARDYIFDHGNPSGFVDASRHDRKRMIDERIREAVLDDLLLTGVIGFLCLVPWQKELEAKSKLLRTDTAGRAFAKAR